MARCLLAALVIHLVAVPLAGLALDRRFAPQVTEVTELEVVWTRPPPAPAPPAPDPPLATASPAPPSRPEAIRPPGRRSPAARPRPPRRVGQRRPALAPPSPQQKAGETSGLATSRLDLSMRAPGTAARPDLNLSPDFEAPAPVAGVRRGPTPETAEQRGARVKARLDRMLAADRPRRNVTEGRVHPVYYDVERDATAMFRPDWSLTEGDPLRRGSFGRSVATLIRALGKGYKQNIDAYMGHDPATSAEAGRSDLLDGYTALQQAFEEKVNGFGCVVCAEITAAGPRRLRVVSRSGNRVFDRLALRALTKATRSRSLPDDAASMEACYRFSASFFRVPPLPLVGCSFDESVPTISCYYPGKKVMSVKVELRTASNL